MNEQRDHESVKPHSDGELSEDSLYEWNGDEWVAKTHAPFRGFARPLEDPVYLEELHAPSMTVELITRVIVTMPKIVILLFAMVVAGLFLWICFGPLQ